MIYLFQNRWRSVCALGAGGIALLYWRIRLAGSPPVFATADNPAARETSIFTRILTFSYLPVFNFFLLLYPSQLSFDWSMDAIPRISTIFDIRNLWTIIFYTIISKVTWKAIIQEFKKRNEIPYNNKESKYYKSRYGNCKRNQKSTYYCNRNTHRNGLDSLERRSYYTPYRESVSSKKQYCQCTSCKHALTEDHTNICRAVNNNNNMTHQSICLCSNNHNETQIKMHKSRERRLAYRSPHAAVLIFFAFTILPFLPASNALFYVGFVVAERVLYMPSVGFCLLLGLGAGLLTRGWHRCERRSRLFTFTVMLVLMAMCSRTLYRNLDWRDEESLFRSALHINPPKGRFIL